MIGFLLNCSRVRPKSITYKTDFHLQSRSGNRIPWLKVGVSMVVEPNVKVTVKRLDYYIGITNREGLFGSNRWVKVERGQLWSDQSPSWTQLRFLIATVCSRARDRNLFKIFGGECANAPNKKPVKLIVARNTKEGKTQWCNRKWRDRPFVLHLMTEFFPLETAN